MGTAQPNMVDKSCKNTIWLTPEKILGPVRSYFGGPIPLDPATLPSNPTRARRFFTEKEDGLVQPWDFPVFVNPPFGRTIRDWLAKIHLEASRHTEIIALLPCGSGRPGTIYWGRDMLNAYLRAECYVRGRINFLLEDGVSESGNTFPSLLSGYNVDVNRFCSCFEHLGKVLKVKVLNPEKRAGGDDAASRSTGPRAFLERR